MTKKPTELDSLSKLSSSKPKKVTKSLEIIPKIQKRLKLAGWFWTKMTEIAFEFCRSFCQSTNQNQGFLTLAGCGAAPYFDELLKENAFRQIMSHFDLITRWVFEYESFNGFIKLLRKLNRNHFWSVCSLCLVESQIDRKIWGKKIYRIYQSFNLSDSSKGAG